MLFCVVAPVMGWVLMYVVVLASALVKNFSSSFEKATSPESLGGSSLYLP